MTTIKTLRIPLSLDASKEILIHYSTPEKLRTLRQLLMQTIKTICNNTTAVNLNKKMPCKIEVAKDLTRSAEIKEFPVDEIDFESYNDYLKLNPDWLPEELTKDKVSYFEIKIKEKTFNKMIAGSKLLCARIEKFNESLEITPEETEKMNEEQTKAFEKAKKIKQQSYFTCFEEFVYEQLYKPLTDNIMQSGDIEIETDFQELYPVEKAPKS